MANKKIWLGVLVIMLVFGMTVAGCDNGSTGETDTWTDVSSLSQLNGTWKGSYSESITMKESYQSAGQTWTSEMENTYGSDLRMTTTVEVTVTVNATAKTYQEKQKITYTYSGSKINTVWTHINIPSGYTVDNSKHSITSPENILPLRTLSDEEITGMLSYLKINQNGTKMKVPANLMGTHPEMIFTKQ